MHLCVFVVKTNCRERFHKVLPVEVIELMFRKCVGLFSGKFFNTVFVLWAFVLQVLSDGKHRSCSTAVGRIAMKCMALGQAMPETQEGVCESRTSKERVAKLKAFSSTTTFTLSKPSTTRSYHSPNGSCRNFVFQGMVRHLQLQGVFIPPPIFIILSILPPSHSRSPERKEPLFF